jgi:tetratricopeptide (TPR) repeat protein
VLFLAAQLADGLAFIHARGICHRDLKPSNVLLGPDDRPRLLDFNLCAGPRAHGRLGGTLPYMAPEQLRALAAAPGQDVPAPDARADLYSLGVKLYELLAGEHPAGALPLKLDSAELREHLLRRQQAGPRPLRQANPDVDRGTARLVERCLAPDPQERPDSAAALAADLRRCLSPLRRVRRGAGRRRGAVLAAALGGLLVLFTGARLWSRREPYAVRQLNQGQDDYRQGDYDRAVGHFTAALRADPRLVRALVMRGRACQRLGAADRGNFGLALADFQRVDQLAPDGKVKACMGYCRNRLGFPHDATFSYHKAIEAGFHTAAVFNNLGCSYLERGKVENAQQSLDQAIALDPTLQAAFHNRALVFLHRSLSARNAWHASRRAGGAAGAGPGGEGREASVEKLKQLLGRGISDIEKAIELGPGTAKLYYDAARLCALAAEFGGPLTPALKYSEQAVAHGYNPQVLGDDLLLEALKQDDRFPDLIRRAPPPRIPQPPARLIDPLQDSSD